MAKKKKQSELDEVTMTQELPCPLTEEEFVERSTELANEMTEREQKAADLKDHVAAVRGQLKEADRRIRKLRQTVHEKAEPRVVEVQTHKDFKSKKVWVVRLDTGEAIPGTERAMTPADQQEEMFDDE